MLTIFVGKIKQQINVLLVVEINVLEEFYIFAVIMDPVQTSFVAPFILYNNPLLNWKLKFKEMVEWFQNCSFSKNFS